MSHNNNNRNHNKKINDQCNGKRVSQRGDELQFNETILIDEYELSKLAILIRENEDIKEFVEIFLEHSYWREAKLRNLDKSLKGYKNLGTRAERKEFIEDNITFRRMKECQPKLYEKFMEREWNLDDIADALEDWIKQVDLGTYKQEYNRKLKQCITESIPPPIEINDDEDDNDNNNNKNISRKDINMAKKHSKLKSNSPKVQKTKQEKAEIDKKKVITTHRNYGTGLIVETLRPDLIPTRLQVIFITKSNFVEIWEQIWKKFDTKNLDDIEPTELIAYCAVCIYNKII